MAKIAVTTQKRNATRSSRPLSESERGEVEQLAYRFFADRNYEHGFDAEDWLRAETIIKSRRS